MKNVVKLGVVAALTVGAPVMAADAPSRSYLEAGVGYAEVPGVGQDAAVWNVAGSLELPKNVLVAADYRQADYDGAKIKTLAAGLGYQFHLTPSVDLVPAASFEQLKFPGNTADGFGLSLGSAARISEKVELSAAVKYVDLEQLPSFFSVKVGARYHFNPQFAAGLDVQKSDLLMASETQAIATLRYDFGARR